jgi:hypothetical protein
LLCALGGLLAAQDRRPAFVTVVDQDGKPVEGAKVVAFAAPDVFAAEAPADVVEATSDARGRAVVRLQVGLAYSGYAVTAPAADGAFAASACDDAITANAVHELRLGARRPARKLALRGAEAWRQEGPLAVQVLPAARQRLAIAVEPGVLPPLPRLGSVRLVNARGEVLWMTQAVISPAAAAGAPSDDLDVALPPPMPLGVRVCTVDGRPVAGAELWQWIEDVPYARTAWSAAFAPRAWRRLGKSGADGTATVAVAADVGGGKVKTTLCVEARAPALALGQAGVEGNGGGPFSGHDWIAVPADQVLPITLAKAQPLRVTPPQSCRVLVFGKADGIQPWFFLEEGPVSIDVDAEGLGSLPLPVNPGSLRVARVRRPGVADAWSLLKQQQDHTSLAVSSRCVQVRVRDARGGPVTDASLALVPWNEAKKQPGYDVPLSTDAAGAAEFAVDGNGWLLWAQRGDDAAWRWIGAGDAGGAIDLQLQPIPVATLRCVDAAGKPLPGLDVACGFGIKWGMTGMPADITLVVRLFRLLLSPGVRHSGSDGTVTVTMLPVPGLEYTVNVAATNRSVAGPLTVRPGDRVDVVFR